MFNIGGAGKDNSLAIFNRYISNEFHGWHGGGFNTTALDFPMVNKNFSLNFHGII